MLYKRNYCRIRTPESKLDVKSHPVWNENKDIKYVVYATKKEIGGVSHLLLFFYTREGMVKYVVFQQADDYVTMEFTESGHRWRKSRLENLFEFWYRRCCATYSGECELLMTEFCNNGYEGMVAVNQLQLSIYKNRYLPPVRELFREVPDLPEDWDPFVFACIPHYIFYDATQKGKKIKGFCTKCRKEVDITRHKYNAIGICPSCAAKIKYRSDKRRGRVIDRSTFQIVLPFGENRRLVRIFKMISVYPKDSYVLNFSFYETAREVLYWDGEVKIEGQYYYDSFESSTITPWRKGFRPTFMGVPSYNGGTEGILYPNNLTEVFLNTPFQNCAVDRYAEYNNQEFDLDTYLAVYVRVPIIEQLLKAGYHHLVQDIIYHCSYYRGLDSLGRQINVSGSSVKEILGMTKPERDILRRIDGGMSTLKIMKTFMKAGIPASEELVFWMQSNGITDGQRICEVLKHVSHRRLVFYLNQQIQGEAGKKYDASRIVAFYSDYLHACKELGYDMKNSFVLFPKHFMEAHDEATRFYEKKLNEEELAMIKEKCKAYGKQYSYEKNGLMLVAPRGKEDLIKEGQVLHNCVGTYGKRIAKGETAVMFVRSKVQPDQPLCCIEIRGGEIKQAEMKCHAVPSKEVKDFLADWKREKMAGHFSAA